MDLPALLQPGDLLVFNDTKVMPARLVGRRGAASIEVTLYRDLGGGAWRAFAKGARRLRAGDRLVFAADFAAEVAEKHPEGDVTLRFDREGGAFRDALARYGAMPLPPYIKRPRGGDPRDRSRLSDDLRPRRGCGRGADCGASLHASSARGARRARHRLDGADPACRTRHLSAGQDHRSARPQDACRMRRPFRRSRGTHRGGAARRRTHRRGRNDEPAPLETAAAETGEVRPFSGETRLFIVPGYQFRAIDMLLTNFHLPRSTLLMLVAAISGLERIKAAYAHAVAAGYRFFSYGDACLIERAPVPSSCEAVTPPSRLSPGDRAAGGSRTR